MQAITTIGLDIAKSVFQVHGVDAGGQVVSCRPAWSALRLALRRIIGHASLRPSATPSG